MEKVVLVLGGGGVKGMAHAGAWRAIQEAGVEIAEIVGTSIGGLVGAGIAGGDTYDTLRDKALALQRRNLVTVNRWAILFNGIRQQSVFRGDVFADYVRSIVPVDSFDELSMPVSMNAMDLGSGEMVWLGAGGDSSMPVTDAVIATCSLPVFYPPYRVGDRWLVDGGIGDPLPIRFAAERGADRVIAIDVGSGNTRDADEVLAQGMVAIHHRATEIMGYPRKMDRLETWDGPPLVYVRPAIDEFSTFEFGQTEYFLEEGYRATAAALAEAGLSKR